MRCYIAFEEVKVLYELDYDCQMLMKSHLQCLASTIKHKQRCKSNPCLLIKSNFLCQNLSFLWLRRAFCSRYRYKGTIDILIGSSNFTFSLQCLKLKHLFATQATYSTWTVACKQRKYIPKIPYHSMQSFLLLQQP